MNSIRLPLVLAGIEIALLTSCSGHTFSAEAFRQSNEIVTYVRPDETKVPVTVGIAALNNIDGIEALFMKEHPDIQIIVIPLQNSQNDYYPPLALLEHQCAPDVCMNIELPGKQAEEYLEDLLQSDAVVDYYPEQIEATLYRGKLYSFPGPGRLMVLAYNKPLFTKYGWSVPQTFSEFITLCDRIRRDTGGSVEPFNPNGKYTADFITGLEAFCYSEVFGGLENKKWYADFLDGSADFSHHMSPFFSIAKTMIDHGLIRPEDQTYSYTQRSADFAAGRIAMIPVLTDLIPPNTTDVYGFAPFPATEGKPYIPLRTDSSVSKVKKKRSAAHDTAVNQFIMFLSTPEAQKAYINDAVMFSSLKTCSQTLPEQFSAIQETVSDGRVFRRIDFHGGVIPKSYSVMEKMRTALFNMAENRSTPAQAANQCEQSAAEILRNGTAQNPAVLARATKSFTVLETSEYIADKFRAATGADIALVPDASIFCGNICRFFKGNITRDMISAEKPRSLANHSRLVKVRMTGNMILNALNDPPALGDGTGNCVYASSGLITAVEPWAPAGGKYRSVVRVDGTPLNANTSYSVAFWEGMVKPQYCGEVLSAYADSYEEFMSAAIAADGTISPARGRRMKLIWK